MSLEAFGDEPWDDPLGIIAVTERLLRMPPPVNRGLIVNRPAGGMDLRARLFQAAMWREYAMTWHGRRTRTGIDQAWCERIGRLTYAECLRRARVNLYLARRLRRASTGGPADADPS
jgi:hypothetical protein